MNDWPPHRSGPPGPHPQAHGVPGFPPDPRAGPPPLAFPPQPPVPPGFFGPGPAPLGVAPKVKKGDVRAAALALLAERPRNGYQIIQEIAERSHGIWRPSPGSVYPALAQLEDEGLVRAEETGGRRTYRLTAEGRAYVAERRKELADPWAAVAESVSEEMVDLHTLLGQVAVAMRTVAEAGTHTQRSRARTVLADTRRALYRILAEDDAEQAAVGEAERVGRDGEAQ